MKLESSKMSERIRLQSIELITFVIRLISEGWCKHVPMIERKDGNSYCLGVALQKAKEALKLGPKTRASMTVDRLIMKYANTDCLTRWNDMTERTQKDVLIVLHSAKQELKGTL